ncbi:MAG: 2-hydroxyacyl-CoA dehydratase [Deltaproteobacteria bacterium]|nr:2-hydroxyacyl-CoA dehydratase [Deltaproteobacteria bacterium]
MFTLGVEDALRIAAEVSADPARAVSRWKALTGRKAVGCLSGCVPEEAIHAAGMLPVSVWGGEGESLLETIDAWVVPADPQSDIHFGGKIRLDGESRPVFRFVLPEDRGGSAMMVTLLDRVEELCEWAEGMSVRKVTEGALDKAVRAYNENRKAFARLEERMTESPGGFTGLEYLHLVEAGWVLSKGAHTAILREALGRESGGRRVLRTRVFLAGGTATAAVMRVLDRADAGIVGDDLARGHRYFTGIVPEGGDMALALARALREKVSSLRVRYAGPERMEWLFRRAAECGADRILMLRAGARAVEYDEDRETAAQAEKRGLLFLSLDIESAGNQFPDVSGRIKAFVEKRG